MATEDFTIELHTIWCRAMDDNGLNKVPYLKLSAAEKAGWRQFADYLVEAWGNYPRMQARDVMPAPASDLYASIDETPLTFGKYNGKTPEEVAALPPKQREWLVWAYETCLTKDVCSYAMYKSVGGTGKPRKEHSEQVATTYAAAIARKSNTGFDDMDDDIPF